MIDTLLSGPFVPFTLSLALLFGLLTLEIALLLVGASLTGIGADAGPDLDGPEVDLSLDIDAVDMDAADLDLGPDAASAAPGAVSPLTWLGLGRMPLLIWLAAVFLSFGVTGLALQAIVQAFGGTPLSGLLAAIPSAAMALWFTGRFGTIFARLLPRTETQSVSTRHLGRRMGIVTQGIAARGSPAEVRVTDRYGNTHYLRAEPLRDVDTIPQGTAVLVLRHRPTGGFRLIAL